MIKISKHYSSPESNTTLELSAVWDLNFGKKPKAHSKEMVKQKILQKLLRTKDDPILERNQIQKICELQPYENKRLQDPIIKYMYNNISSYTHWQIYCQFSSEKKTLTGILKSSEIQ